MQTSICTYGYVYFGWFELKRPAELQTQHVPTIDRNT